MLVLVGFKDVLVFSMQSMYEYNAHLSLALITRLVPNGAAL